MSYVLCCSSVLYQSYLLEIHLSVGPIASFSDCRPQFKCTPSHCHQNCGERDGCERSELRSTLPIYCTKLLENFST